MAAPEAELRARARRAYEQGRWRAALWGVVPVLALVALALPLCGRPELVLPQGALLAAVLTGLRWRGQSWGRGAEHGLLLGVAACLVPFAGCSSGLCPIAGPASRLLTLCFAAGALAGGALTLHALRRRRDLPRTVSAVLVAGLAASMSCAVAGAGGIAGMALGLALASGPALALARQS